MDNKEITTITLDELQYDEIKKKIDRINLLQREAQHLQQIIESENGSLVSMVRMVSFVKEFTKIDLKDGNRIEIQ